MRHLALGVYMLLRRRGKANLFTKFQNLHDINDDAPTDFYSVLAKT
jgi:hypothetical protein